MSSHVEKGHRPANEAYRRGWDQTFGSAAAPVAEHVNPRQVYDLAVAVRAEARVLDILTPARLRQLVEHAQQLANLVDRYREQRWGQQ